MKEFAGRVSFSEASFDLGYKKDSNRRTFAHAWFACEPDQQCDLHQPFVSPDEQLFVGDVRLDNRPDIERRLGLSPEQLRDSSDAWLLFQAWQRWQGHSLELARGDYAFAIWSERSGELFLARGPLSPMQLFYHRSANGVAFASRPRLTLKTAGLGADLDVEAAANFIGGLPAPGRGTFFAGLSRLPHAHRARFTVSTTDLRSFWRPVRQPDPAASARECADRLVMLLDRAVNARLRRESGEVAAHLSAGRDSGAVASSAALELARRGQSLIAITAAPAERFSGLGLPERLGDESLLAAQLASLYANAVHRVVRPDGDPLLGLDKVHAALANPVAHLSNFRWFSELDSVAAQGGATVVLVGSVGNFGLSAGGEGHLAAVLAEEGAVRWMREALSVSEGPRDWARICNQSFGGRMPVAAHRLALKLAGRGGAEPQGFRLLREPHRRAAQAVVMQEVGDRRPPRDPFAFRAEMIMQHDPTNAVSRLYGMDTRDPTGDQDLLDFCFTIPAHLLVGRGESRPLFDRAFGARLAWSSRPRGYQAADWSMHFTKDRVGSAFNEYREIEAVRDLLDFDYIDELIRRWPATWANPRLMLHYRNDLLGALAFAHFTTVNF